MPLLAGVVVLLFLVVLAGMLVLFVFDLPLLHQCFLGLVVVVGVVVGVFLVEVAGTCLVVVCLVVAGLVVFSFLHLP